MMYDKKQTLFRLFLSLVVIYTLINSVSAQENKTEEIIQKENGITHFQNANSSESPEKSDVLQKEIIIETQRSLDRSLSILNMVATLMGVLVTLIAIILAVIGISFNDDRKKMKAIIKDIEKDSNHIKKFRNETMGYINSLYEYLENIPMPTIYENRLSEDGKKREDLIRNKFKMSAILGKPLKSNDYLAKGHCHFYKGNIELALKDYEKTIELDPNNENAWMEKGNMLHRLNQHKNALNAFEKVLQLKPDSTLALYYKGIQLMLLSNYDDAIIAIEKAIELKINIIADAWYSLACVYSLKSDKENALSYLEKAINKDPSNKDTAKDDEDFKKFRNDEDFKKLVN